MASETLLLLAALASASAGQFDLLCVGTKEAPSGTKEPYRAEYRIDLVERRYCEGECGDLTHISQVNDHYIILTDFDDPRVGRIFTSVDRRTGAFNETISGSGITLETVAQCDPKPFRGFPVHPRKF